MKLKNRQGPDHAGRPHRGSILEATDMVMRKKFDCDYSYDSIQNDLRRRHKARGEKTQFRGCWSGLDRR